MSTNKQALRGQSVDANFYLAECCNCGQVMPSSKLIESRNYPDGDADCYCPHCNADDCDINDMGSSASEAWNYQQKRIEALLDELEAADSRNAEQAAIIAKQEKWIKDVEATMISATDRAEAAEKRVAPDAFNAIAENIRTQDNRITSYPMFCVYQKREVVADADYDHDRIVWVDEDGNEATERKRMRLEFLHENYREPPEKWRRVAVKEIDDFVTCCFTEQGCKDYLACNGHNLRLPFIYVKSGFRNAEYIGIRDWLAGITVKGE